jgi:glycosyl-4,4'-diaponeurosporenoate acyltransferase
VSLPVLCLNVVLWAVMQLAVARIYVVLPDRYFNRAGRFSAVRWREIRFYRNALQVRRWKDLLPDGEGWVGGEFSKKSLQSVSRTYLERFVRETRRGEAVHWTAILCSALFFTWNPPITWPGLVLTGLVLNLPCIVVQRYNRFVLVNWLNRR